MIILGDQYSIKINDIEIVDPVAHGIFDDMFADDRPEILADMIEIGARVIKHRQDGEAGEIIRDEFDRVVREVNGVVEGIGGGMVEGMRPIVEHIARQLTDIRGRLDGALAVTEAKKETESERERGTAKGRPFEEEVAAVVQSISNYHGDVCDHVGDLIGPGGSKAGDIVVEIGAAEGPSKGRIVFETKTGRLSRNEALRELDRVRESRDAGYSVLVVPRHDKMPANTREFQEYGGDKMIITYQEDPGPGIEVAYALARARVLTANSEREGIDIQGAVDAIDQALQQLNQARAIKMRLTQQAESAVVMKDLIDDMVGLVKSALQLASDRLAAQ